MKSLLEITGLHKSFGGARVLGGLDFSARRGEVIGILGRNGAGKTTLFRLILDLLEKDSGEVLLDGKSPDGSGSIRQKIGYVPESPGFHPRMTAAEVFRFRSGFYTGWNMEKAVSTAKRLELTLDKRTSAFSKGSLAKLAWCCAVAHDPDLLLLDEPTSGLDYLIKDKILDGLIGELVSAEKTVIIASHVMEDVFNLTDRLAVLSGGGIQDIQASEKLKSEAFLVTARLKSEAGFRGEGAVLSAEGRLVTIGVIGREKLEKLKTSAELENTEHRGMTPAETFKTLLAATGEEL